MSWIVGVWKALGEERVPLGRRRKERALDLRKLCDRQSGVYRSEAAGQVFWGHFVRRIESCPASWTPCSRNDIWWRLVNEGAPFSRWDLEARRTAGSNSRPMGEPCGLEDIGVGDLHALPAPLEPRRSPTPTSPSSDDSPATSSYTSTSSRSPAPESKRHGYSTEQSLARVRLRTSRHRTTVNHRSALSEDRPGSEAMAHRFKPGRLTLGRIAQYPGGCFWTPAS